MTLRHCYCCGKSVTDGEEKKRRRLLTSMQVCIWKENTDKVVYTSYCYFLQDALQLLTDIIVEAMTEIIFFDLYTLFISCYFTYFISFPYLYFFSAFSFLVDVFVSVLVVNYRSS